MSQVRGKAPRESCSRNSRRQQWARGRTVRNGVEDYDDSLWQEGGISGKQRGKGARTTPQPSPRATHLVKVRQRVLLGRERVGQRLQLLLAPRGRRQQHTCAAMRAHQRHPRHCEERPHCQSRRKPVEHRDTSTVRISSWKCRTLSLPAAAPLTFRISVADNGALVQQARLGGHRGDGRRWSPGMRRRRRSLPPADGSRAVHARPRQRPDALLSPWRFFTNTAPLPQACVPVLRARRERLLQSATGCSMARKILWWAAGMQQGAAGVALARRWTRAACV